jgi:hypothetical protein
MRSLVIDSSDEIEKFAYEIENNVHYPEIVQEQGQ